MTDHDDEQRNDTIPNTFDEEPAGQERREFLRSLGKWSQAVIGGVLVSDALTTSEPAEAWYNRGGWGNRGGGWGNRGGGWHNRSRGWND
jgi:hypothetical protein